MQIIADLHVHSKYSRATSKSLSPEGLKNAASIKGIDVIGTGDFTHPKYLNELKEKLSPCPDMPGFFKLKKQNSKFPVFMLTQEISCIYSQDGRVRRNHILVCVPDFNSIDLLIKKLNPIGNLSADGRPILGISSEELAKIILDTNQDNLVIPAHIWTPWFSMFGSKSGFDSIEECFGEMAKYIYAIETGLSSDPLMNWGVKNLDNVSIVSHGDAHSQIKVGREATVYELENISYYKIVEALKNSAKLNKNNMPKNFIKYTIEFYPEEGKYHFDGHRECRIQLSPKETKKNNGICPKCKKKLTVGVMNRVESLADRSEDEALEYAKRHRPDFKKIVPLVEIISEILNQGVGTKKVSKMYNMCIEKGGSEFNVLLNMDINIINNLINPNIAEAINRMRKGDIYVSPGYDGVFGDAKIFSDKEKGLMSGKQVSLF